MSKLKNPHFNTNNQFVVVFHFVVGVLINYHNHQKNLPLNRYFKNAKLIMGIQKDKTVPLGPAQQNARLSHTSVEEKGNVGTRLWRDLLFKSFRTSTKGPQC